MSGRRNKKPLKHFSIGLDYNRTTFVPGQKVEGQVSITLRETQLVQLIRVRFMGQIKAQMYRNDSSNYVMSTIFKEIITVFGQPFSDGGPTELGKGEHVFPFVFRVPPINLPCSYETHKKFNGPKGKIRYSLTGVLVRPGSSNKMCSTLITIPSSLDASDEEYNGVVEKEKTQDIGTFLSKKGHIQVKSSIPRAAFYPESAIPICISIINQSGTPIILTGISIRQKVMFRSLTDERGPFTEKIHELQYKEVFPSTTRDIQRIVNINIPPTSILSPSIKTTILDVIHFVVVKVKTCSESSLLQNSVLPPGDTQSNTGRSPLLRRLKLDTLREKLTSQKIKIELPLVICGFPFMLLDSMPDRVSMDTLPVYEREPTDEYFDNDVGEEEEVVVNDDDKDEEIDADEELVDGENREEENKQESSPIRRYIEAEENNSLDSAPGKQDPLVVVDNKVDSQIPVLTKSDEFKDVMDVDRKVSFCASPDSEREKQSDNWTHEEEERQATPVVSANNSVSILAEVVEIEETEMKMMKREFEARLRGSTSSNVPTPFKRSGIPMTIKIMGSDDGPYEDSQSGKAEVGKNVNQHDNAEVVGEKREITEQIDEHTEFGRNEETSETSSLEIIQKKDKGKNIVLPNGEKINHRPGATAIATKILSKRSPKRPEVITTPSRSSPNRMQESSSPRSPTSPHHQSTAAISTVVADNNDVHENSNGKTTLSILTRSSSNAKRKKDTSPGPTTTKMKISPQRVKNFVNKKMLSNRKQKKTKDHDGGEVSSCSSSSSEYVTVTMEKFIGGN